MKNFKIKVVHVTMSIGINISIRHIFGLKIYSDDYMDMKNNTPRTYLNRYINIHFESALEVLVRA